MNDILLIACGAGLQDGLNPCIFMTCSIFIIFGQWVSRSFLPVIWARIIFVLVYAYCDLIFNFGLLQKSLLQKNIIFTAKIAYFVLGVCFFILGVIYFKNWFLLCRGIPVEGWKGDRIKFFSFGGLAICLGTVILPALFCAVSILWPMNQYVFLLGSIAMLRNQWQTLLPLMGCYIVVSMWSLWMVWAFIGIKKLRPSLLKIFCAAIFFTASSCMILIFK